MVLKIVSGIAVTYFLFVVVLFFAEGLVPVKVTYFSGDSTCKSTVTVKPDKAFCGILEIEQLKQL